MRRRALALFLALLGAAFLARAEPARVVPADDPDVAAGWSAYRADRHEEALAHYRRAAARNERVAQFNLAVMLLAGEGGPADPVEGMSWLRKSADLGFARAQYALALLYELGILVARFVERPKPAEESSPQEVS